MADINLHRFNPITTGIVTPNPINAPQSTENKQGEAFADVLRTSFQHEQAAVNFSKHAQNRINDRNIDLGDNKIERLNQGVKLASEKGLNDTLILVDKTAFIVSVKNGTVITTLNGDDLNGNVFTNIDGTVII